MKKICFISTVSITLKSFVVETAKFLHEQCGYDVTLICNNDDEFAKSLPSYLHYIPVPMARGINFSGFKSIKTFKDIFKKEKFDLVQYSTPNASFYASVAAKQCNIPIRLYAQWGIRYVGFQGIKRIIFKLLEKIVCKNSTNVFAVSNKNMQFAINEKLYPSLKSQVVGNGGTIGVDLQSYNLENKTKWKDAISNLLGINRQDFVFGFAGRVSKDKGCEELLTAFKEIVQIYNNAKLLIVGPMEDDCGVSLDLLNWAKESNQVVLTGSVENSQMKEYYSVMDVLVHPTYREGFGMVIQEAGALAVPVITTNIPGASEVMVDGESCILVNPKSIKELKSRMLYALENKQAIIDMGKLAYDRTVKLYDCKVMLENQKVSYNNLLERK